MAAAALFASASARTCFSCSLSHCMREWQWGLLLPGASRLCGVQHLQHVLISSNMQHGAHRFQGLQMGAVWILITTNSGMADDRMECNQPISTPLPARPTSAAFGSHSMRWSSARARTWAATDREKADTLPPWRGKGGGGMGAGERRLGVAGVGRDDGGCWEVTVQQL